MFICDIQVTEIRSTDAKGTPARGSKAVATDDFVDPLSGGLDPLSADGGVSLAFEGADPLSRLAAEAETVVKPRSNSSKVILIVYKLAHLPTCLVSHGEVQICQTHGPQTLCPHENTTMIHAALGRPSV